MKINLSFLIFFIFFETSYCFEYIDAERGLALREEPNTNSRKILIIPNHSRVYVERYYSTNEEIIDNIYGSWVKVHYKGQKGWAFSGYITSLSVMISKEKTNNDSYFYEFTTLNDYKISNCYDEHYMPTENIIDKVQYISNVFKGKSPKLYVLEENKNRATIIKNFNINLFNNGMYEYPALNFISKLNFDPNYSLLLKEDAYIDFTNRHKKNINTYKIKQKHPIKLKNIDYIKIYEQWLVDLNGDGKKEIVSYINKYLYTELGTNKVNAIVVTFYNSTNVLLTEGYETQHLEAIQLIPFYDYPVIKIYISSLCSGENGEFMILFESNSTKPFYDAVNFTHSY
ncbi:MAG: SH3 domain-containing protein [Brevinematales bacterium]